MGKSMNSVPPSDPNEPQWRFHGQAWIAAWKGLPEARKKPVLRVAQDLKKRGFRAWLVGGAVRDLCLGRSVGDLDMVSAATPEDALEVFPDAREIGKSFGIVQVLESGQPQENAIELATFRLEEGYSDGRHPDRVRFTESLELDAQRRDFTCNALYLDPLNMELQDPTGGLEDLAMGRLQSVGDPVDRFAEDGLRLLRVARFLARFDFEPAPGLLEAALESRDSLRGVSAERIYGEFERMATGHRPDRALWALHGCGLVDLSFGAGLDSKRSDPDQRVEMAQSLWAEDLEREPEAHRVLWFALGLEPNWGSDGRIGLMQMAELERTLQKLSVPSRLHRQVMEVSKGWRELTGHAEKMQGESPALASVVPLIRTLRESHGWCALELGTARCQSLQDGPGTIAMLELGAWFEDLPASQIRPDFLPSGKRWIDLGLNAGPALGDCMRQVEDAALRGEILDQDQAEAWWLGT